VMERGSLYEGQQVRWFSIADSLTSRPDVADPLAHDLAFAIETLDGNHHVVRASWIGGGADVGGAGGSEGEGAGPGGAGLDGAGPGAAGAAGGFGGGGGLLGFARGVPAGFVPLAGGDDLEVLDGAHVTAFVVSDNAPVVGDVVT